MTHFVIHVGPHKTGTTYLQEAFVQNRATLLERNIFYPDWWGPRAHYDLFYKLEKCPDASLEAEFAELHAKKHETVLISVEGLVDLREPNVAYFRKLVGDASAEIVFYARSWGEVVPSTWREIVKEGSYISFPEFACQRLANPWTASTMNFAAGLDNFSRHFGKSNIKIVAYNQLVEEKIDLFRHFAAAFLGWPNAPQPDFGNINSSLGSIDTETIRAINYLEFAARGNMPPTSYSLSTTNAYLRLKEAFRLDLTWAAQKSHLRQLEINETAPGIRALHREVFASYEDALVDPKPPRLFFVPRSVAVRYVSSDYLMRAGVVEELEGAHRQITSDLAGR